MITKILILVVCAALGTVVGFGILREYKRKQRYLEEVCAMIRELKRNMDYRRDCAASVLKRFMPESSLLKDNIAQYLGFVESKDGELKISRGYLSKPVHDGMCELFLALGCSDGASEKRGLNDFSAVFEERAAAAKAKTEKFGALAVKLGFLFGLCIGILAL